MSRLSGGSRHTTYGIETYWSSGSSTACTVPLAQPNSSPRLQRTRSPFTNRSAFLGGDFAEKFDGFFLPGDCGGKGFGGHYDSYYYE